MSAPTLERVLPHNLEAEQSVLGAVLIERTALAYTEAAAAVTPPQFYREAHRRIFQAMARLADQQSAIDLVTLTDRLRRDGDLEAVGGPAYVASLVDGVPQSINLPYYAGIVVEKARLRDLIYAANRIVADAYAADRDVDVLIDEAQRLVLDIGQRAVRRDFVVMEDWIPELYGAIAHARETRRVVTGVPTGFAELDRYTRGWQPGDLVYLGARPSVGKTSLALQMALHAADDVMTGFLSLEMSRRMIGFRAVSMLARIDAFRLMTGYLTDKEDAVIARALERLREKRLAIDDSSGLTIAQLSAKVRRLAKRYGLGIVFVDYVQLLRGAEKAENRNLDLGAISAGLKALAKDLDIPVIVLSQLGRDTARAGSRPAAHHLRDSGSLEQDADVVVLLHRPKQDDAPGRYQDGEKTELIIDKQRNGPRGVIALQWIASQMRFGEVEAEAASTSDELPLQGDA